MKKRVFIGVLAALMLFAFVACDNSVPTVSFKDVSYVSIEQVKDYIKGETPSEDGFRILVNYTEGTPTELPGSGNVDIDGDVVTVKDNINFTNLQGNKVSVVAAVVEYKTVTGASISGVESATIKDSVKMADLKDITTAISNGTLKITGTPVLTLSYDGGSKSYSLADVEKNAPDVVLSLVKDGVVADAETEFKANDVWAVTLDKYRFGAEGDWEAEFNPALSTGMNITVVDGTTPDPDTTPAKLVATVNAGDGYYGTDVSVTFKYQNAAGEDLETAVSAGSYYVMDSTGKVVANAFDSLKLSDKAVTYTVRTTGRSYLECKVIIPAGKNYITNTIDDINVIVADGEKVWKAGDSVSVTDFKIEDTITYAISGNTTSDDYIKFTVSEAGSDFRLTTGDNTIHYQIQYSIKGAAEKQTDVKTLTINVQ